MENTNLDLILKPISESSLTGIDARYEFCYEMMELEIKKFGSLFGETVEWSIVEKHAYEVLTLHSKDLKVLAYFIRALLDKNNFIGLKQGLNLLKEHLSLFGSDLYPKRKRARDGAISWLITQLETSLPKLDANSINIDDATDCINLTGEIDDLYIKVYPDSDINFNQINTIIQRFSIQNSSVSKSNKEHDIINIDNNDHIKKESSSTVLVNKLTSKTNEVEIDTDFSSPKASKNTLKKVAEFMMYSDVSMSLAYRLNRYCTWYDMDEIPPYDKKNKTELSLPISHDKQIEYREQTKQETEESTIKQLEKTLINVPFWFTGHYFMYLMLTNLKHHDAAKAVKQETQQCVARLNGIENLSFSNEIPFADEDTLNWLSVENTPESDSISYLNCDDLADEDVTLESLGDYVAQISSLLSVEVSGRNQWILYTKIIKAYQRINLFPLCLPYLEIMWNIKEEINLIGWEPQICKQFNLLSNQILIGIYSSNEKIPEKYQSWLVNSE